MGKARWAKVLAAFAVFAVLAAGSAYGITLRAGNLIAQGDGGFAPKALPQDHDAPIKLFGHGRLHTVDGTRPSPLRHAVIELDKHGHAETRGLEKCTKGKLIATTTKQARAACPGAIVGTGYGTALIELPEQRPIEASSALTIFNAPEKDGNPTGIGHAYLNYPVPTTYLVEAELEKVHHGRYGYRVEIDFPKIVNDYGSPISGRIKIDKKWIFKGMHLSVANARCADGRLQARIELTFKDGTFLQGSAFKLCKILH
ncbi:MAG: hypothetical protein ACRDLL_11520 [Solirubrobacterales bacterium]